MGEWVKEEGPPCCCGNPTFVSLFPDGRASLVCLFHSAAEGAMFPLPRGKRPDHWPNCTFDEMKVLVEEGIAEEGAEDGD